MKSSVLNNSISERLRPPLQSLGQPEPEHWSWKRQLQFLDRLQVEGFSNSYNSLEDILPRLHQFELSIDVVKETKAS